MPSFATTLGTFKLQRIPHDHSNQLLAWNAADEYLLNTLQTQGSLNKQQQILLINDQFGALANALHTHQLQHWSDSYTSQHACRINLEQNKLNPKISYIKSIETPTTKPSIVIIKIPKSTDLLKDQLIRLKPIIDNETLIIAGGMVKHISHNILKVFNHIIGSSEQSLAKKKARLIFCKADSTQTVSTHYPKIVKNKELNLELHHHANVFSKSSLDIGTRFLLEQFHNLPKANEIIDLGCGNGILGIIAKQHQPTSKVTFIDESYMAIDSATYNYHSAFGETNASFITSHELPLDPQSIDLVLCNPPFHHEHVITNHIAWQMLEQSYQVLKKGGAIWCVANRHLNYHNQLKRLFSHCKTVAANKKFVVLAATK